MHIKSNTQKVQGEHRGVPFSLEAGILFVSGTEYSKAEIRLLVELGTLLEVEGFEVAESLPPSKPVKGWGNFWLSYPSSIDDDQEDQ